MMKRPGRSESTGAGGENMAETLPAGPVATRDLRPLAYVQHMAETARSGPAKCMFEMYAEQERRRLAADGAGRLS